MAIMKLVCWSTNFVEDRDRIQTVLRKTGYDIAAKQVIAVIA